MFHTTPQTMKILHKLGYMVDPLHLYFWAKPRKLQWSRDGFLFSKEDIQSLIRELELLRDKQIEPRSCPDPETHDSAPDEDDSDENDGDDGDEDDEGDDGDDEEDEDEG